MGLKLGNLGEMVRLNENEPGPKTQRFFERTRDGKLVLRKRDGPLHTDRGRRAREAGFLGARRELVPRREHRLRAAPLFEGTPRSTNSLIVTRYAAWSASTSRQTELPAIHLVTAVGGAVVRTFLAGEAPEAADLAAQPVRDSGGPLG